MIRSLNLRRRPVSRSGIDSKGSILIVALWSVLLLAAFAVILGSQVRYKMTLVKRLDELTQLRSVAEAGVMMAAALVKAEELNTYYSMADKWSNNPQALRDVDTGIGRFTVSYDYAYDRSKPPQTMYGPVDEERKINLNKADMKTLKRLFMLALGMAEDKAQDLAASIVDWRDGDEELSIPTGSAESSYYRGLTYPYEAKNADFEVLDELLLVKGVDQQLFDRIKGYVTVYGTGRINVNTASREVLIAAGLKENMANDILLIRMGKDNVIGTEDDGIFDSTAGIVPGLSQFVNLGVSDLDMLTVASEQYLTVSSSAFTVYSYATARNRKGSYSTTAVIDKKGKVLCWKES